jgi:hypothetical protein
MSDLPMHSTNIFTTLDLRVIRYATSHAAENGISVYLLALEKLVTTRMFLSNKKFITLY